MVRAFCISIYNDKDFSRRAAKRLSLTFQRNSVVFKVRAHLIDYVFEVWVRRKSDSLTKEYSDRKGRGKKSMATTPPPTPAPTPAPVPVRPNKPMSKGAKIFCLMVVAVVQGVYLWGSVYLPTTENGMRVRLAELRRDEVKSNNELEAQREKTRQTALEMQQDCRK